MTRRGPAVRVHVLGWWRGPSRLLDDLGPGHRDDFAAWVAAGVAGNDLFALAGHRTVAAGTATNRAVLFDRHTHGEPRSLVPFAPLDTGLDQAEAGRAAGGPAGQSATWSARPGGPGALEPGRSGTHG